MTTSNGFTNTKSDLIALFFILAYIAELILCTNVDGVKFLLGVPVLAGALLLLTNKEIPIQAGKLGFGVALMLLPTVIFLIMYSTNKYSV
jgi:hypothetical protein